MDPLPSGSGTEADLRAVWGKGTGADTVLYAVGLGGAFVRVAAGSASRVAAGVEEDLHGVWVDEGEEPFVVAVGAAGTVVVEDGSGLRVDRITLVDLLDVHGADGRLFAVGEGGRAFEHHGAEQGWRPSWTGADRTLRGVWVGRGSLGEPMVFAVGDAGTVLELVE